MSNRKQHTVYLYVLDPTYSNFDYFPKDFLSYFGNHKTCSFSNSHDGFYSEVCKITSWLKICLKKALSKMNSQAMTKVSI